MIGYFIQRTAGDAELRARLARLGVTWRTESVVIGWDDAGARVRGLLTGDQEVIEGDTLVLATTNVPETSVVDQLAATGFGGAVHVIGDALAARLAVHAILDGRRTGLAI